MNKNENTAVKSMSRGFTLIELLVVVAIIGILGTIAVQNVTEYLRNAEDTAAEQQVQTVQSAVTAYYMKYKKMPSNLQALVEGDDPILEGGDAAILDPWGNELKFEIKNKQRCVIISSGRDGEFGNDDDHRSDKKQSAKKKD